MTRRWVGTALALVALQGALLAGGWVVDRGRRAEATFRTTPLDEVAPALVWERPDGTGGLPDEPVVVHFWATWCAPCRDELPALLAASEATGVRLIAVTDEPWPVVDRWFDGDVPAAIVGDRTGAAGRWGVSALPDTYVVDGGRIHTRVAGARDWSTPEARAFLRQVVKR